MAKKQSSERDVSGEITRHQDRYQRLQTRHNFIDKLEVIHEAILEQNADVIRVAVVLYDKETDTATTFASSPADKDVLSHY